MRRSPSTTTTTTLHHSTDPLFIIKLNVSMTVPLWQPIIIRLCFSKTLKFYKFDSDMCYVSIRCSLRLAPQQHDRLWLICRLHWKVQIFWKGHKYLAHLPLLFQHYLHRDHLYDAQRVGEAFGSEHDNFSILYVWNANVLTECQWVRWFQKASKHPDVIYNFSLGQSLVVSNYKWKMGRIFAALSEYLDWSFTAIYLCIRLIV